MVTMAKLRGLRSSLLDMRHPFGLALWVIRDPDSQSDQTIQLRRRIAQQRPRLFQRGQSAGRRLKWRATNVGFADDGEVNQLARLDPRRQLRFERGLVFLLGDDVVFQVEIVAGTSEGERDRAVIFVARGRDLEFKGAFRRGLDAVRLHTEREAGLKPFDAYAINEVALSAAIEFFDEQMIRPGLVEPVCDRPFVGAGDVSFGDRLAFE